MSIDEILAQCIADIELGASVDDCLARYPEHAAELIPLLTIARQLRSAVPTQLSDEAFARGRRLLQEQFTQPSAEQKVPPFLRKGHKIRRLPEPARYAHKQMPIQRRQKESPRRVPNKFTLWMGVASSVAAVVVAAVLLSRIPDLHIEGANRDDIKPVSAPVPTYTPTQPSASTTEPSLLTNAGTESSELIDLLVPTFTLLPTEPGQFVPATAVTILAPLPTVKSQDTALSTATSPIATLPVIVQPTQPPVQPVVAATHTLTPLPNATWTIAPVNTHTPAATPVVTLAATLTIIPATTATITPTVTFTPTPLPPTATETVLPDTPTPIATPTATVYFTPIVTVEVEPTSTATPIDIHVDNTPTPEVDATDSGANGHGNPRATRTVIFPTDAETPATVPSTLTPRVELPGEGQ